MDIIIRNTTRLRLYLQYEDIMDLYNASKEIPEDNVINTKCGFTLKSVLHLFSLRMLESQLSSVNKNDLYSVEITGVDKDGYNVKWSHGFVMIFENGFWYKIDSDLLSREVTIRQIDWTDPLSDVPKGNDTIWTVLISRYERNPASPISIYNSLIKEALLRLDTEDGKSDEFLSLLSPTLNISEARDYLNSLDQTSKIDLLPNF